MIMLKSTHIKQIVELKQLHNIDLEVKSIIINHKNDEIEKLENENSKLHTKLIVKDRNISNCFDVNARITKELKEANMKIATLEKENTSLVKRNEALKKLFKKYKDLAMKVNTVNISVMRKLWANKEAQRQLRRLADNEEVNNIHTLRRYVKELAMLIGI